MSPSEQNYPSDSALPENDSAATQENEANSPGEQKQRRRWGKIPPVLIVIPLAVLLTLAVILIIVFTTREGKDEVRDTLYSGGLLPVAVETVQSGETVTRWGYINKSGEFVIPAQFEDAGAFAENGLAAVRTEAGWGYINKSGVFAIEAGYEDAGTFGEYGYAPVKRDDSWGYIDKKGKIVVNPQFDMANPFTEEGLALVKIGEKYGYINRAGAYVIVPRFEDARDFHADGTAQVKEFGKWGIINTKGEYVVNPQFDEISAVTSCGLTRVEKDGRYGYIDKSGVYVILPEYTEAEDFSSNGLALVSKDEGYFFINKKNETVLSGFYRACSFGSNGLAPVQRTAKSMWEYIDRDGASAFGKTFADANIFSFNMAAVENTEGRLLYLNEKGQELVICPENCEVASPFSEDGFALLLWIEQDTNKFYFTLINKKGTVVLDRIVAFRR